jgi:hypothetical protein
VGTSGGYEIQISELYGAFQNISQCSANLMFASNDTQANLADLGAFWGTNGASAQFGRTYQQQADDLFTALNSLWQSLDGTASGVRDMAKRYGLVEEQNTEILRSPGARGMTPYE